MLTRQEQKMATKPEPPPEADDPEQSRRFIDMAREVEVNEDPEAFEKAFKHVVRPSDRGKDQSPKNG
jgi:hypothetical protein